MKRKPYTGANIKESVKIVKNACLADYGTFRLGGPCRELYDCATIDGLEKAVRKLASDEQPFILVGGGSNILFSDHGFCGTILRFCSPKPDISVVDGWWVSGASNLDALVSYAAEEGCEGINFCSGIPGTVGGAIVGNAGAWGKQIGDSLLEVELMNRQGVRTWVGAEDLGFAYRHSNLKSSGDIVVSARLKLTTGSSEALLAERAEILATRVEKHPDLETHPCIGSFFRNIEPTSAAGRRQAAGWFLEQAGANELVVGGARLFEKHANIIVHGEGCTAQDVFDLSRAMQERVADQFALQLEREIRCLGFFQGAPESTQFF
jgi:UDP-N-acetylmuramate dehydrogenase